MTSPSSAFTPAPCVGVIMLQTEFARPPGDIGNAASFAVPPLYEVVGAATLERVVKGNADDPDLLVEFLAARDRLVARGAQLISTSCGLLVKYQDRLQAGCPVPVAASSLFQIARRKEEWGEIGIMAMDAASIDRSRLQAAGAPEDMPVIGLEAGTELYRVLSANRKDLPLDHDRATADVVEAGRRLLERTPTIGAIVLECTNLPPYRAALSQALALPVYDILTWIDEVWRAHVACRTIAGSSEPI